MFTAQSDGYSKYLTKAPSWRLDRWLAIIAGMLVLAAGCLR